MKKRLIVLSFILLSIYIYSGEMKRLNNEYEMIERKIKKIEIEKQIEFSKTELLGLEKDLIWKSIEKLEKQIDS